MERKEQKCMLCNQTAEFEFIHKLRDDTTRNVYKCGSCGHVQVLPLPTVEEDNEFYQSDTMYKSIFSGRSEFQKEENLMYRYRDFVYEQAEQFEKHLTNIHKPKILDIGTGYGWLVEFMRGKGFDIDGIELSDEKRDLCKQRCGIELFDWNFLVDSPDLREKTNHYDVICMMQTLEHIGDPITFLRRASRLLKPKGGGGGGYDFHRRSEFRRLYEKRIARI
jgi:2-polyprenyl-3-methyl-5-hydroxy-6-metoxy-1,4-benzoquinol methylase